MKNNVWIVITSINYPTQAVRDFAKLVKERGWSLLVVGDTKTPVDWNCDGTIFLSIDKQYELFPVIGQLIPVKHYCRKNIGYLYAIQQGATVIIDTDDDNLPYDDFALQVDQQVTAEVVGGSKWSNIYSYFSDDIIWPRGLPLKLIHEPGKILGKETRKCLVQQSLADKDPDVDAIFRLVNKKDTYFKKTGNQYIIAGETYVPFNSQNTVFFSEAFPLMYLPCFVSFRMTDIWRSFIVKRVLNHMGASLSFHEATVWQDRNEHDLMRDFNDEVIGYQQNENIIAALDNADLTGLSVVDAISKAWSSLHDISIITEGELKNINEWLSYFK